MRDRFLKEAPQAWEKFHVRAKRLQGSFLYRSVLPGDKLDGHTKGELKQKEGFALFTEPSFLAEDQNRSIELKVINPQYGFELRKRRPTSGWKVADVALSPVQRGDYDRVFGDVEMWTNAPITIFGLSGPMPTEKKGYWPTIINEPGFLLKSVSTQAEHGNPLAKVEFKYRPNSKSRRVPVMATGWAVLDPARHWSMRQFDIVVDSASGAKLTYSARFQYEPSPDGFPVLKRIDVSYRNPQKSYESENLYQFDLREADVPTEEFTLSGFGFPEPVGVVWPKPTRWWLWISLGAVGTAACALLFFKLRKRYQSPDPESAEQAPESAKS